MYVNLITKCEVSISTGYEDERLRKMSKTWEFLYHSHLHTSHPSRQSAYEFLLSWIVGLTRGLCLYLAPFARYSEILSKIADFKTQPAFGAHLGWPIRISPNLWRQKTKVHVLLCGLACVMLRSKVLVELLSTFDRHMDGHMGNSTSS